MKNDAQTPLTRSRREAVRICDSANCDCRDCSQLASIGFHES
jgi:hypothetical protein